MHDVSKSYLLTRSWLELLKQFELVWCPAESPSMAEIGSGMATLKRVAKISMLKELEVLD